MKNTLKLKEISWDMRYKLNAKTGTTTAVYQ